MIIINSYLLDSVPQVTDYLQSVFAKRKSPNKLKVTMVIGAKPWLADTQHPLYEAGKAAVKRGRPHIPHPTLNNHDCIKKLYTDSVVQQDVAALLQT